MASAYFMCLILILQLTVFEAKKKGRHGTVTVARIEKAWACRDFHPSGFKLTYIKLQEVGRQITVVNANISVGVDAPPKLVAKAIIRKCKTIEDEKCELFLRATVDLCRLLDDRNNWFSGMLNFQPRFHCPVKKGMYTLRNGTFDAARMLDFVGGFFPPEFFNYHWWWRLYFGTKAMTEMFCVDGFVKLYSVRE